MVLRSETASSSSFFLRIRILFFSFSDEYKRARSACYINPLGGGDFPKAGQLGFGPNKRPTTETLPYFFFLKKIYIYIYKNELNEKYHFFFFFFWYSPNIKF